jgi:hypothetical protein
MAIAAISASKAGVHGEPHEVCEPSLFGGSGRRTSLQRAKFHSNEPLDAGGIGTFGF